tara:strand:+ start:453 stop:1022 length:570 start_codon:yes stop_codon:yes gene_type:complete
MADGTLKVGQITTSSGSGTITLGQSGETVDMANGTITLNSSMKNAPAFYGELASNTTISRNSYVKVTGLTNDEVDTNTAFDGTTFTVPSGEGGKYFLYASIQVDYELAGDDGEEARCYIYKNGSEIKEAKWRVTGSHVNRYTALSVSMTATLSASDTIELYTLLNDDSGANARLLANATSIGGYKLIGI